MTVVKCTNTFTGEKVKLLSKKFSDGDDCKHKIFHRLREWAKKS